MPPEGGIFLSYRAAFLSNEGFDALVQAALVTSGLVLVDDAFVDHAIDDRHGIFVRRNGSVFVAGITSLDDILDLGAQ